MSDLKEGNVADLIWDTEEHDLVFTFVNPSLTEQVKSLIEYRVKGALLEGESFGSYRR